MFSSCLKQNKKYLQSLYIINNLNILLKTISDLERINFTSKKIKTCIKIFYMSLISMI